MEKEKEQQSIPVFGCDSIENILSGADERSRSLFFAELFKNENKEIVSFDFDDTLFSPLMDAAEAETNVDVKYVSMFKRRFDLLKQAVNNENYVSIIVTARTNNFQQISDFCELHNLNVDFIITHAGDKSILKDIKPICHYDDDPKVLLKATENGIPTITFGEWFSPDFIKSWMGRIENNDTIRFYLENLKGKGVNGKDDLEKYKSWETGAHFFNKDKEPGEPGKERTKQIKPRCSEIADKLRGLADKIEAGGANLQNAEKIWEICSDISGQVKNWIIAELGNAGRKWICSKENKEKDKEKIKEKENNFPSDSFFGKI